MLEGLNNLYDSNHDQVKRNQPNHVNCRKHCWEEQNYADNKSQNVEDKQKPVVAYV